MINHLQGILIEKQPTNIVIDVLGIGFNIKIPLSSFDNLGSIGNKIKILIHLIVREDALELYGFSSEAERKLFQLLIGVSRIGPSLAIKILSGISPSNLQQAILNKDIGILSKLQGVGKKTAQRLIMELEVKISKLETLEEISPLDEERKIASEALSALINLGYNHSETRKAIIKVRKANKETEEKLTVEELIRQALQVLYQG